MDGQPRVPELIRRRQMLEEFCDRLKGAIDVSRFPLPMQLNFGVTGWDSIEMFLVARVKDRDTGLDIKINQISGIFGADGSFDDAVDQVRHLLGKFVLHEFDECFRVDGKQLIDPHAGDRRG